MNPMAEMFPVTKAKRKRRSTRRPGPRHSVRNLPKGWIY